MNDIWLLIAKEINNALNNALRWTCYFFIRMCKFLMIKLPYSTFQRIQLKFKHCPKLDSSLLCACANIFSWITFTVKPIGWFSRIRFDYFFPRNSKDVFTIFKNAPLRIYAYSYTQECFTEINYRCEFDLLKVVWRRNFSRISAILVFFPICGQSKKIRSQQAKIEKNE